MSFRLLKVILLLLVSLATTSCGEYELLELQNQAKRSADSLFRLHKDSLRSVADSFCHQTYDSLYTVTLDSLRAIYKRDIEKLIGQ